METLGGFPTLPATGLVGQSPPEAHANRRMPTAALRASMARSAAGASRDGTRRAKPAESHAFAGRRPRPELASNRARTLGARVLHGRTLPRNRPHPARAPSWHPRIEFQLSSRSVKREHPTSQPLHGSDGAQGERSVPTVGVRSRSGRPRPDAKRRPRATWARIARPKARVGVAGLRPAEPECGKVWKPSQGFHFNLRRAGHFVLPLQPSARRARAPLSRFFARQIGTASNARASIAGLMEPSPRFRCP
jgi:hypothetical protein